MNRRHWIRTLAMSALAALATSTTITAGAERDSALLRVGESLQYDKGLKVTFLAVSRDHRCPINAQCLTQGNATVILRVKAGRQAARNVKIHTHDNPREVVIPANEFPPGMAGIPKSYVISIAHLNPLPLAGNKTSQTRYRLGLRILVAQ